MKIKLFTIALWIVLSAATISAAVAQKTYTQGVVTYVTGVMGQNVEIKEYFTTDSVATTFEAGPATIKLLSDANHTFFAVLVHVPVASIKKAAVYTPEEINKVMDSLPTFTFAPTTETKQISGYNCSRVIATNTQDNKTYDVWITSDIAIPSSALPVYYQDIGGFPIQYTTFQQGQSALVTIKGVSEDIPPVGIFSIPSDFDRISKDDLAAMGAGQ